MKYIEAFINLLAKICGITKATTIKHRSGSFTYILDTETREASLLKYKQKCKDTTEVVIPASVMYRGEAYKVASLGERCFYGCTFTSIKIPKSVTSLRGRCFSGCYALKSVEIPESVTSLGDFCFWVCSSLKSIKIPESVTSLGRGCFSGCSSLKSIKIPKSITSLSIACFEDCSSLTSIEIPESVENLGERCLWNCDSLQTVICKMRDVIEEDLEENILFGDTPIEEATLYVPKESLNAYNSTTPWSFFGKIQPWTKELDTRVETPEPDITIHTNNGNVTVSGL
ncbi:MAG: leucine-rich repeat domain-containing protein, partial [Bacteroidaceae bacterium]|nr:leucine-rich repeat domain-containing protein [Bacteroidaceae bacterium]